MQNLLDKEKTIIIYKLINLNQGLDKLKNYCALFYGLDAFDVYLTDPVLDGLLEVQVLYIHKFRSFFTFYHQIYSIFFKEYVNYLWKQLTLRERIGYYKWQMLDGYEFLNIRKLVKTSNLKNTEIKNYTDFEFKKGMMQADYTKVYIETIINEENKEKD